MTVKAADIDLERRLNARAIASLTTTQSITDGGDATALPLPVGEAGVCVMTGGAGAQTRTLADPIVADSRLTMVMTSGAGTIAVTAATAIDVAGNTTITFDAGDFIELRSTTVGGALVWRVVGNSGCTLT